MQAVSEGINLIRLINGSAISQTGPCDELSEIFNGARARWKTYLTGLKLPSEVNR